MVGAPIALVLAAIVVGAAVGVGGHLVIPAGMLAAVGVLALAQRPFIVLCGVWFVGAAVPYGLVADRLFRVDVGGVPIHPVDAAFWLGVVVWGVSAILGTDRRADDEQRSALTAPLLTCALVIGMATVIGLAWGNEVWDVGRDLRNAAHWIMVPIAFSVLRSPARIKTALVTVMVGSAVFSVLCIVLALVPDDAYFRKQVLQYWHGSSRIYFHNHYVMLLTLPLGAAYGLVTDRWRTRLACISLVVLNATALYLSVTRSIVVTAPAASVLACFIVTICTRSPRRWRRLGALMVAGSVAFGIGFAANRSVRSMRAGAAKASLGGRFEELVSSGKLDRSLRGRMISYRQAFEDGMRSPLVGLGIGSLFRIPWAHHRTAARAPRKLGFQPAVDNTPLTLLVKSGAVGLAAALWLLLAILWSQWRGARTPQEDAWIPAALLAATLGLAAVSMLQTMLLTSRFIAVFALAVAASDRLSCNRRQALAANEAPETNLALLPSNTSGAG